MATRLTQGGKTPISERISIFEQKQQTPVGGSAAPSPGRIVLSTTKTVTTSRHFSAIKSQFDVTPSGSSTPTTPSPPSSNRGSSLNLSLTGNPGRSASVPTPAARLSTLAPAGSQRSGSPPRQLRTPTNNRTSAPSPAKTKTPGHPQLPKANGPSPLQSFMGHLRGDPRPEQKGYDTDKVNGNLPPPSPTVSPPPLDNFNVWHKTSFDKEVTVELGPTSPNILDPDLDNVKSLNTTANLNLKNMSSSSSVSSSNGQVRSTYWTSQALQNDNSQKMSEALKLDLDFKDEKINSLSKELDDLHTGGATEEEVATLKKQKHELELRLKEEEEEIDDLAGQVQMLEQSKIKLEMSMAAMKKEHRRELSLKEEELEDARAATQKKVKTLEQQLENEHEERLNFVREKHELETKIINLQEMASRSADEEQVAKLKKDLKRTKALLKDAQVMIDRSKSESSNKVVMRQLKNQLEDAEFAKTAALKAKQNIELELSDVQTQLDDVLRSKSDLEDRLLRMSREKADLSTQLDDSEEELQEVMKKYKASVSQLSVDQITIQEQANRIADIEEERNKLKEQIAELTMRIESLEGENVINAHQNRLELKIKELESKLELEQTTRGRMETQINRLKEGIEKINSECDLLRNKELSSQDLARKLQRQLRELREDYASAQQKETEANAKKNELEKQLELAEAETVMAKNDLKLAMKRIEDLQTAINGELDSESDSLNSDVDSDTSDEGMENFLEHHRRACSVQRERESVAREAEARASIQREVRASIARESVARTLETMSEEPELKLSDGSLLLDESASIAEMEEESTA